MTRSVGHLLLIALLLACPIQCVVGGDFCCASNSDSSVADVVSVDVDQVCPLSGSCCHHSESDAETRNTTDEQPTRVPPSDDDCRRDCLCKGAISSPVQVVDASGLAILNSVPAAGTVSCGLSHRVATPLTDPPDPISGREIRALRMSFQV